MATYNRASFIVETLKSVQSQSYQNFECIIVDDGGSDNTLELITPILNFDSRFSFQKRLDSYTKGLPGCRNYGIDLAQGDYIIFFDDDDIVHPDNLKIGVEVLEINHTDFCHYQKQSFQNKKPKISNIPIIIKGWLTKEDIEKIITQEIGLASCTVLWKKECFATIRFTEALMYAEEWECYSRIISENFKGIIISNVLYYNRKHFNSNTGEFYNNNYIRRKSYGEAMSLVVQNLKEKQLLSNSMIRYFIAKSIEFKEYNLFKKILNILDLPTFEKVKWQLLYITLPWRLIIYKIKKIVLTNHQ